MRIQLIALALAISAASNVQSASCKKPSSLNAKPHSCNYQVKPLVAESCVPPSNLWKRPAAPRSLALTTFAAKNCPAVSIPMRVSKCRAIRGTSLKDPQCEDRQFTNFASIEAQSSPGKSLVLVRDASVTVTSKEKQNKCKAKVAASSPTCNIMDFDYLKTKSCPKGLVLKKA